jgi:hypothetical protein
MVLPSVGMGRKLSADILQLAVPEWLLTALAGDPSAGVDHACEMVSEVRDSGQFEGCAGATWTGRTESCTSSEP